MTINQSVGQIERATQNRVVKLLHEQLKYDYLGDWRDRENNSNIEVELLRQNLLARGYSERLISRAIDKLRSTANNYEDDLYVINKNVYELLRYGVSVVEAVGENSQTVQLIDWNNPERNHFAVAEEVTYLGNREKRPDVVLYINGIAVAVLELKRSTVSVGDGIRQSIVNQRKEFIQSFFTTVQFIFAGNDTEGLRYGTIKTPEKYYWSWKEDIEDTSRLQLDKYLLKMCEKKRFLDLMFDFVVFDGGKKKLARAHQYFGVKAAQDFVIRKEGGIIWHTQGSGKSLVMVWLAKWILENNPNARVIILTDRIELDKQITTVFNDSGEKIKRTESGEELMNQLASPLPRLICSLVHKFGKRGEDDFEKYIDEIERSTLKPVGELFVFVDECHRTQSGKMHRAMKAILRDPVMIGFTGTPLLKKDAKSSIEVFGRYIHTYKFNEAVQDKVVLDLTYEARDVDSKISSPEKIDAWFESKTKGLNDFQKSELKKKWGTMQQVMGAISRLKVIVSDIILDFNTKPRLSSGSGNAILVASSIYDATRYFTLFQETELKGKCAIVTSYNPATKDITTEDTGANTETDKEFIYNTYMNLLEHVKPLPGKSKSETYEDKSKELFIKEPDNMKLLVVVDKLLTGFDAPPCTYLYIDKNMQDHGLFQAICRVNRLDGEDKMFGYIADYKDLFKKVEHAVSVYTTELNYDNFNKEDVDILLKDRLTTGKERLDAALDAVELLCEPVAPPKGSLEYIRYFCGNPENPDDLKEHEPQRTALYKHTAAFIRAYANIADELSEAGYSEKDIARIKHSIDFYLKLREEIRMASGETLDLKTYEADMRHLIDTYIQAGESKRIDPFGEKSILDIIVEKNLGDAIDSLPQGIKNSKEAVAETIENNVRQKIIREHLIDPAYFEEMSKLLDELIKERRAQAIEYQEYLKRIAELAMKVANPARADLPPSIRSNAQRALYNNLDKNETLALQVDERVRKVKRADFRGNQAKENEIKAALFDLLKSREEVERVFSIIKEQHEY